MNFSVKCTNYKLVLKLILQINNVVYEFATPQNGKEFKINIFNPVHDGEIRKHINSFKNIQTNN